MITPNEKAFLSLIAWSEGTALAPDPYRVCYLRRHIVQDLAYHPADKRPPDDHQEWAGELITKGVYAGQHSTAAGRYQINHPTWIRLKAQLGLESFEADAQDAGAIELLRQAGALPKIESGAIEEAIGLTSHIWASFAGSSAGQPTHALASLLEAYSGIQGAGDGSAPA